MPGQDYWTTDDVDPRRLCHDALVAIDETRRPNNGQPSLWASLFDQLGLARGDRVVHIGAGTGYYSAILAEIVGPSGRVTALEIDAGLAERARDNLRKAWPWANVLATDGFATERPASRSPHWCQLVGRIPPHITARPAPCGSVRLPGGHHPLRRRTQRRSRGAIDGGRRGRRFHRDSLQRPPEEPDASCWLAGEGWWLSTAPADEG